MIFEYENLVLLKSPQNNVASNIAITEKKKQSKSDISCMPRALWDKIIDFTDKSVVQYDVPAAKILHKMTMIMMIANKV